MSTFFTLTPWAATSQPSHSSSTTGTNLLATMAQLAQNGIPLNAQYQPQAPTSLFQPGPKIVGGGPPRRRYPEYYPPKEGVDPTKTLAHFHLLLNLPVEIIGLIVEHCATADGVCLSLTSKHMYTLTRPLLLRRTPTAFTLTSGTRRGVPLCLCPREDDDGKRPIILPRPPTPTSCKHRSCKPPKYSWQPNNTSHCGICASCPLQERLKSWMGKEVRYCPDSRCTKFLPRKKLHKGLCLHGGPRPKKRKEGQGSLTWTHKRGSGGWQRNGQMWKSLYTEADMRHAMDRYTVPRTTNSSYSLRRRPKPTQKRKEHIVTRGGLVVAGSGMYSEWRPRTNWLGEATQWEWVNKRTGEVRTGQPSEEEEFGEIGWGREFDMDMDIEDDGGSVEDDD